MREDQMDGEPIEAYRAADVAYDVAMRRLDEQMRQIDAIDNKIAAIVGAATGVAALFSGFAAVAINTGDAISLATGVASLALVALLYVPAVGFGVKAYWFYQWDLRPNWDRLLELSRDYEEDLVRSWVADGCVRSLKSNSKAVGDKLTDAGRALWLLLAQALAAAVGLLAIVVASGV